MAPAGKNRKENTWFYQITCKWCCWQLKKIWIFDNTGPPDQHDFLHVQYLLIKKKFEEFRPNIESHDPTFFTGTQACAQVSRMIGFFHVLPKLGLAQKLSGRGPTGLRARFRNRGRLEIHVMWSRKRSFKMVATELGYLRTKLSFWLSLWHDISISWHGGKEL